MPSSMLPFNYNNGIEIVQAPGYVIINLEMIHEARIDYEMTIEDPEVLADKWTVSYPMFLDPEYEFFEYACHEDNTAVRNFIETSRYERGLPVHPGRAE